MLDWSIVYLFMTGYMFYRLCIEDHNLTRKADRLGPLKRLIMAILWPATSIFALLSFIYDKIVSR